MFHFFQKCYFWGHFEVSIKVAYFDLMILKPSIFYAAGYGASFKNIFCAPALADVLNFTFSEKNSKWPWPWNMTLRPNDVKDYKNSVCLIFHGKFSTSTTRRKLQKNWKTDIHSLTLNLKSMTLTPKQKIEVEDIYNAI